MSDKIALVCGHFLPEMGYFEVHLAKAFAQLGHDVHVFTTNLVPSYVQQMVNSTPSIGRVNHIDGYTIHRLKSSWSLGQMVKAGTLLKEVQAFNPSTTVVIGLGKLFPKPIFNKSAGVGRVITLLGDNEDTYDQSFKKRLMAALKNPVYKAAVQHSGALRSYTPSTPEIVKTLIPDSLHATFDQKNEQISLGFDPADFYHSEKLRQEFRAKLGLDAEVPLLITATRVTANKRLNDVVEIVDELNSEGTKLDYLIIGLTGDEASTSLKNSVANATNKQAFKTLEFQPREALVGYYNAADVGYWPNAAISIFEALGTGLPLVLPDKQNISHILRSNIDGTYAAQSNTEIKAALKTWGKQAPNREQNASEQAERYSYTAIASKILETKDQSRKT
jgi:glycosyltransferase involved in cell wall biosynthesis